MTPEDIETEWLADQMASGNMKNLIEDDGYDAALDALEDDADSGSDVFEEVINDVR